MDNQPVEPPSNDSPEEPSAVVPPETAAAQPPTEVNPPSETPSELLSSDQVPQKRRFAALRTSPHKRRNWAILIGLVLLVMLSGSLGWALGHHKTTPATPVVHHTASRVITPVSIKQTKFLTVPIRMADGHFFKDYSVFGQNCTGTNQTNCPNTVSDSDVAYYQIGTTADGQPIIDVYDTQADEGAFSFVAIGTTTGNYAILGLLDDGLYYALSATNDNSSAQYATGIKNALSTNVTLDTTSGISQLLFPHTASIQGLNLQSNSDTNAPNGYFLPNGLASIRGAYFTRAGSSAPAVNKLGTSGDKSFYEVTAEDQPNYAVKEIYSTVNAVYATSYKVNDPLTPGDNSKLKANWTSGDQTSASYSTRSSGCGSANGYVIANNVNAASLTTAGTGPNGETLYTLPTSSALFQEIYNDDYSSGTGLEDASLQNLSVDQFQAKHGVFLAKNALGELVVYLRDDMIQGGGCGKPVVYLYPQSPMKVSVKVAATITKSDPVYPVGGWQNILALPGSKLFYDGKGYNSLFWEGLGDGIYPAITSGTVVPHNKVVGTIRQQLAQQGLNGTEINDFMTFWQPKLPTTPYTRLTWLSTAQMNQLAPLNISPKPTTMIRVFLDFQGLQQPANLSAQHFSAPARQGFTVVEWGGLLKSTQ